MADLELIFHCRSRSSPDITHQVSVEFTEEELIFSCDCTAYERAIPCHHISRLIDNDISVLTEPSSADQLQDLALFQSWMVDTTCREDFTRLHLLEQEVKELKKFKKHISDSLQCGWKRKSWMESEQ